MLKSLFILLLLTLPYSASAADAPAKPLEKNQAELKIGAINLTDITTSNIDKATTVKMGKRTVTEIKLYRDDVFGKQVINIGAKFQALGEEKIYVSYYAVFQNSAGNVIGAAGGEAEVTPGESGAASSATIPLPTERFKEIAYYQVVLYESDKTIGVGQ